MSDRVLTRQDILDLLNSMSGVEKPIAVFRKSLVAAYALNSYAPCYDTEEWNYRRSTDPIHVHVNSLAGCTIYPDRTLPLMFDFK